MAGSVNKVILIGNLGKDPEVRHGQDGTKIVNMNIATSESWKDRASGERKEKTEWHRVVIFNPHLADIAERYLKKGSTVYIEGALQTRKWTDQSGVEKYSTEVVIGKFKGELTLLGGRDSGGGGGGQQGGGGGGYDNPSESSYGSSNNRSAPPSSGGRGAPPSSGGGGWDAPADLDDEIPF